MKTIGTNQTTAVSFGTVLEENASELTQGGPNGRVTESAVSMARIYR